MTFLNKDKIVALIFMILTITFFGCCNDKSDFF